MKTAIIDLYTLYLKSDGVEIDSRKIESNKLFFALKGENVDGHDYVQKVIQRPNVYAIIDNENFYIDERTILVSDTLKCIQELSRYHRAQFNIPVIGITGSNGKTTTKELLYQVLNRKFKVHSTLGNYNNHLGVPLTLLKAPLDTQVMIIEMGANHIGEIEELCSIAMPNYGLITNIGNAHIEGFGSYEGVIRAKTEMYKFLALNDGKIFYNKNDEVLVNNLPQISSTSLIQYPSDDISILDNGLSLLLIDKIDNTQYVTTLYGLYNATNIYAAYAIGSYFDILTDVILDAVSAYEPTMNRSQLVNLGESTFILDAYNANPTSMKLGIKSIANLEDSRDKILVLGDMKELGDDELEFHQEIIDYLSQFKWAKVFLVGSIFSALKNDTYHVFSNVESLISHFPQFKNDFKKAIVLLKASRSIQLEKFKNSCF